MIAQERAWAEQSCGKPWVLSELLAMDFHGTSPKGTRYDRPTKVPTYDPATFHSDCRLLDSDARSFGDSVAVVYGSESSVSVLPDSKHERRCLVWTDTDASGATVAHTLFQLSTDSRLGFTHISYRGSTYAIQADNERDAAAPQNHSLQALSLLNELVSAGKVSSDIPNTQEIQFVP
jgi:hypothetical protein